MHESLRASLFLEDYSEVISERWACYNPCKLCIAWHCIVCGLFLKFRVAGVLMVAVMTLVLLLDPRLEEQSFSTIPYTDLILSIVAHTASCMSG